MSERDDADAYIIALAKHGVSTHAAYPSACEKCGITLGDIRLVEHGTDDMALCKRCFNTILKDNHD